MGDQNTVCIIIVICVVGAFFYAYHYGCTVRCIPVMREYDGGALYSKRAFLL